MSARVGTSSFRAGMRGVCQAPGTVFPSFEDAGVGKVVCSRCFCVHRCGVLVAPFSPGQGGGGVLPFPLTTGTLSLEGSNQRQSHRRTHSEAL